MHPDRWEVGSFHHWVGFSPPANPPVVPWPAGQLLSSGRDALRVALAVGARDFGWRRLWVPDYFCQQVVAALAQTGFELVSYPDNPLRRSPDLPDAAPADVVLVMNYFGMRSGVAWTRPKGVGLIEDHSHDLTSRRAFASDADFCVASLRKTTPVPSGGVLWSPRGHALPRQPRQLSQRQRTSAAMLQAMVLKGMYLEGGAVGKAGFRAVAERVERDLCVPLVSEIDDVSRAVVESFPLDTWRTARAENLAVLMDEVGDLGWGRILWPSTAGSSPFSAVLIADSAERREWAFTRLVRADIYPAILWPLESPCSQ